MKIFKLISTAFLGLMVLLPLAGQNKAKSTQAPLLKAVASVYSVKTADELKWLVAQKSDFEGFTIRLEADIDFGNKTPLTTGFKDFAGTFDGNGKTIRNFKMITTMKGWEDRGSAFIFKNRGTIKNLTLDGTITGLVELALLVGENDGMILNCTTRGKVAVGNTGGGIAYKNTLMGTIEGCRNYAEIGPFGKELEPSEFGGIVALSGGNIIDCHNYGTITGSINVGGIAGKAEFGGQSKFKDCINYGQVLGNNNVGGIVGHTIDTGVILDGCVNAGIVRGSNHNTAGILASNDSGHNIIRNCRNTGLVSGGVSNTAGIVALDGGFSGFLQNFYESCGNSGVVESQGDVVAGIVATTSSNILKCWNIGEVSGKDQVGGIVGNMRPQLRKEIEIKLCFNAGSVRGGTWVGGIIGNQNRLMNINQTYNSGPVKGKIGVGGLVGISDKPIRNSYNCGPVEGVKEVGGISGTSAQYIGTLSNILFCYNAGKISFVSLAAQMGQVKNNTPESNFFHIGINPALNGMRLYENNDPINSINDIFVAQPLSGEAFGTQAAYKNFDFDNIWVMVKDSGNMKDYHGLRPMLKGVGEGDSTAYQVLKTQAASDRLALDKLQAKLAAGPVLPSEDIGTPVLPVDNIYTVRTADELRYLMQLKSDFKGQIIKLAADIDFGKDRVFTSGFARMAGTIDGAGFALRNLTIVTDNLVWLDPFPQSVGFVSILEYTGRVQNLRIESGRIDGGVRTGSIAGHSYGSIINCSNKASVSGLSGVTAGGIVGVVDSYPGIEHAPEGFVIQRVAGCTNSGTVTGYVASGIAGTSRTAYLIDCHNSGKVDAPYAAGIVHGILAVTGCTNSGDIGTKVSQRSAGIIAATIGNDHPPDGSQLIINCHNSGAVQADLIATGIAMWITQGMINCTNSGNITSYASDGKIRYNNRARSTTTYGALAAGLLAYADPTIAIANCTNTGRISTQIGTAGGLIGIDYIRPTEKKLIESPGIIYYDTYIIYNCMSFGEVSSATGLAGIVIGDKAKLNYYHNDPSSFLSVAKSKDLYYLKSATINTNIPPVNFDQSDKFKINTTGMIPIGSTGLSRLPRGWDPEMWTIQPNTKTSIARPILKMAKPALLPPVLVPLAKSEPARWKFGQSTSTYGIMIFDKGTSKDSWRYLSVYKDKHFGYWEAEPNLQILDGLWFYPDADLLYSLWHYLVQGGRYNLPMGLYYTASTPDADEVRALDFFTGSWITIPKNFPANRLALQKFQ